MSQFIKNATFNGKLIPICLAKEVNHAGFKCVVGAIDPPILDETGDKVKSAIENDKLLSADQASKTSTVTITSMAHTSKMDRKPHSSVTMEDPEGNKVATGHVTVDESEQELAR